MFFKFILIIWIQLKFRTRTDHDEDQIFLHEFDLLYISYVCTAYGTALHTQQPEKNWLRLILLKKNKYTF